MMTIDAAAITLRIPNSGDEQLDAMIRQANRRDAAVAAMQGLLANYGERVTSDCCADQAVKHADALLTRLEES
jgi:hypothetical protein